MSIVDKNFVFDKITNNQVYKKAPNGEIIIDHEELSMLGLMVQLNFI